MKFILGVLAGAVLGWSIGSGRLGVWVGASWRELAARRQEVPRESANGSTGRAVTKPKEPRDFDDRVAEASAESFPASDPPGWARYRV